MSRNGEAIKERLRRKQEQKNGSKAKPPTADEGQARRNVDMRRRKIPFGKDGLPAHFTHRKLGFVGIGKILEDQSAERALLIMLFHNWVFRKIFEYDYDDFDDSRVPLFDSMTPQHQVHILATIARGLLLPDTPLPPDDHVHWAGFLALYDQLDSCSETELDNARDELKSKELDREEAVTGFNRHKATHDTIRSLSNAEEKLAEDEIKHDAFLCRGAQTLRDAQQSLRRQKLMAAIVQDEVGADLNEIMKQQLSNQPEPARTTKAGILVGDTCRDPIDTSIPTDDLHRFSWRRALIHFALERGDKHFDDGRMFNLYVIACADRLPRETTEDDDAWGNLIANVRQDVIVLAPEDEKFLWGCLSEEVWARTALTLRTARQAHRAFARSWTSKQGLHDLATLMALTDEAPYVLNSLALNNFFDDHEFCDYHLQKSPEEAEAEAGPVESRTNETEHHLRTTKCTIGRNWIWHYHQVMADNDLCYSSNADRLRALDSVFATHDEQGPLAGFASPPSYPDKYCFEGGYRMPWAHAACDMLLDESPEVYWEKHRKGRKDSCDYVKCQAYRKGKKQECGSCRVATYCTRDCQLADWPTHKEECKVWSTERLKEKALVGTTAAAAVVSSSTDAGDAAAEIDVAGLKIMDS